MRVRGTAVFLNASGNTTPLALRLNVEHNRVLHDHVVILTLETSSTPHVPEARRVEIDTLMIEDDGIALVTARYGFADSVDVPAALRLAVARGLPCEVETATYFLSRVTVRPVRDGGMAMWRKKLFVAIGRNAASPAEYFRLPEDRVISLASSIEL